MLKAMSDKGEIPPVVDRLPSNPMLIQPTSEIGKYGGTWRMAMRRKRDHALLIRSIGYENLVRWNPEWTRVVSNIAQSYSVNDDATEYTFRLRKGMRWSDGDPFDADDIMFWYEDVALNKELSDGLDVWRISSGKKFEVTKVDQHTVTFTFDSPHGLFVQLLAAPEGAEATSYPRHYLEKFHIKYNKNANSLAQAEGYGDWTELFKAKFGLPGTIDDTSRWTNPELPVLHGWVLQGVHLQDEPLIAKRNPYYWKVDPAGQQLPYIDEVFFEVVESKKAARQVAREGRVDMQVRHVGFYAEKLYEGKESSPDMGWFDAVESIMNFSAISLNLTHKDPALRKLFRQKDFRIALSHAIDRIEILRKLPYAGIRPYQAAPRPESAVYHEQLATQYLDYDIAKANSLLDSIGLTKRDAEGFRLHPGSDMPISFNLDTVGDARFDVIAEVAGYWNAAGIKVTARNLERDVFYEERGRNAHDASAWGGDGGLSAMLAPIYYFPYTYESLHAVTWASWFQRPNDPFSEEPPLAVKRQMELYRELTSKGDEETQLKLMGEILNIAAEQFHVIGISLPKTRFGLVRNTFHNVPTVMPAAWEYPTPAPTNPVQYYIEPK